MDQGRAESCSRCLLEACRRRERARSSHVSRTEHAHASLRSPPCEGASRRWRLWSTDGRSVSRLPRWTAENRQFVDGAKPAITAGGPRPVSSTSSAAPPSSRVGGSLSVGAPTRDGRSPNHPRSLGMALRPTRTSLPTVRASTSSPHAPWLAWSARTSISGESIVELTGRGTRQCVSPNP